MRLLVEVYGVRISSEKAKKKSENQTISGMKKLFVVEQRAYKLREYWRESEAAMSRRTPGDS